MLKLVLFLLKHTSAGLLGILASTKAVVVAGFIGFCCLGLWTRHLDSTTFGTIMAVVIPAWLASHAIQGIWGSGDAVDPSQVPSSTSTSTSASINVTTPAPVVAPAPDPNAQPTLPTDPTAQIPMQATLSVPLAHHLPLRGQLIPKR